MDLEGGWEPYTGEGPAVWVLLRSYDLWRVFASRGAAKEALEPDQPAGWWHDTETSSKSRHPEAHLRGRWTIVRMEVHG